MDATPRAIQGGDNMIYHERNGQAYYRQYVVITDIDGLLVSGIFDDYEKAVGHVMVCLWEFSESYKEEGDWFKIGEPEYYDEGMYITIKFQSHHWEKPCEETYFILEYDTRKPELDKPKESKVVTEWVRIKSIVICDYHVESVDWRWQTAQKWAKFIR